MKKFYEFDETKGMVFLDLTPALHYTTSNIQLVNSFIQIMLQVVTLHVLVQVHVHVEIFNIPIFEHMFTCYILDQLENIRL